jgi:hypothetical protein
MRKRIKLQRDLITDESKIMRKSLLFIIPALLITSCSEPKTNAGISGFSSKENDSTSITDTQEEKASAVELKQDPADFLPEGYVIFDKVSGDLNKDGLKDLVLIIKGTEKANFVMDEYRGELDRNRRGLIILFKKKDGYELAVKNTDCFSSENEDGGVYYAPELSVSIEKGNLYVNYAHGRYGYWGYTFRNKKDVFELIGYDSSNNFGPTVDKVISINFLSKRKLEKVNMNKSGESEEEVFKEYWEDIRVNKLIGLSAIKDFDELDVTEYNTAE